MERLQERGGIQMESFNVVPKYQTLAEAVAYLRRIANDMEKNEHGQHPEYVSMSVSRSFHNADELKSKSTWRSGKVGVS